MRAGRSSPAARATSPTAASSAWRRAACAWRSPTSARAAPGCTATTPAVVTDKAERIVLAAVRYPGAPADTLARTRPASTRVLVIGGGVAGTQAAVELAQMGHRVELVERRPFLGGRAARIGTVFPTNDCGQCLPTTDAQAGTRKCFHRNVAIDDPEPARLAAHDRRVGRRPPRRLRGRPQAAAQHRHRRMHQLQPLRDGLPRAVERRRAEGDLRRVLRRPRGAHRRPRHLHLLRRLRQGVPGRGDRLQPVARARHRQGRRGAHRRRLRARPG